MEYEVLLHGLRIGNKMGIIHIYYCGDSDLVVKDVPRNGDTTDPNIRAY
jgi:hypothetical protein